jgi:four helix bundle protein
VIVLAIGDGLSILVSAIGYRAIGYRAIGYRARLSRCRAIGPPIRTTAGWLKEVPVGSDRNLQKRMYRHIHAGDSSQIDVGAVRALVSRMTPEQLRARLMTFAADVTVFAKPLFGEPAARAGADQLVRAATSASANYRAAGHGRSHAEFVAKLGLALEEADESGHWLEWLKRTQLASPKQIDPLLEEAKELTKILGASKRTAKRIEADERRRR